MPTCSVTSDDAPTRPRDQPYRFDTVHTCHRRGRDSTAMGEAHLLLVGIVLLGLLLLHAVTGVAPLLSKISADIGMGTVGATILGMLPTIAFGLAGFLTHSS